MVFLTRKGRELSVNKTQKQGSDGTALSGEAVSSVSDDSIVNETGHLSSGEVCLVVFA